MNTVYFVRHGESEVNLTKEFSHKLIDRGLTPKGYIQAKQTAEYFRERRVDYLYTSPLQRAVDTAKIIAQVVKIRPEIVENFREINVGSLENDPNPTDEKWRMYQSITDQWKNKDIHIEFPDGENFKQFTERVRNGLQTILENKDNHFIVIVTHGGVIEFTLPYIFPDLIPKKFSELEAHNCSISKLKIENKNQILSAKLKYWKKNTHLTGIAAQFESGLP